MPEPKQNRHKSKQDYVTPWEFIHAVEARWGPLAVDLAASDANARAPDWFTEEDDTFAQDWDRLASMLAWLNCEFGDIPRYAAKCAQHAFRSRKGAAPLKQRVGALLDVELDRHSALERERPH
jgi:hypothetical protein